jgi:hypothetical protein
LSYRFSCCSPLERRGSLAPASYDLPADFPIFPSYLKLLTVKPFLLHILLLVGFSLSGFPQNLVLNPSFENFSSCPFGPSEFDNATSWQSPFINLIGDTCSTSDLYNTCSPFGAFGVGVPANILGNQAARTGSGYAGIIVTERFALLGCNSFFGSGWREYVEGTLSAPLQAGQQYCVTVYVSLADNGKYASDNFGVHFANSLVNVNCGTVGGSSALRPLGFVPQLTWSGGTITDANGWTPLQWTYTASGGESFIVFGNFEPDGSTNFTCVNGGAINPYAYYYVDDVSVELGPCGVLPVEVDHFRGEMQEDGGVQLSWWSGETNAPEEGWVLERSADGQDFRPLEEWAAGNDGEMEYRDEYPALPYSYYRLELRQANGQSEYSQVVTVRTGRDLSEELEWRSPNPVDDALELIWHAPEDAVSAASVRLYDLRGTLVHEHEVRADRGQREIRVETAALPAGLYQLVLVSGRERFQKRIVIVH